MEEKGRQCQAEAEVALSICVARMIFQMDPIYRGSVLYAGGKGVLGTNPPQERVA